MSNQPIFDFPKKNVLFNFIILCIILNERGKEAKDAAIITMFEA